MMILSMKKQQGQGLIETMITVLIIGISVTALMHLQNNLAYSDLYARQQSEATIIAESALEKARSFDYLGQNTPTFQPGSQTYDKIKSYVDTISGKTTTYTITFTVPEQKDLPYKNVDVKVAWTDVHNLPQAVELSTIIGSIEPFCTICAYSNYCQSTEPHLNLKRYCQEYSRIRPENP